jgi:hypothetical protein
VVVSVSLLHSPAGQDLCHSRIGRPRLPPPHRRRISYRLGRAYPWPGGFRACWTTNEVS